MTIRLLDLEAQQQFQDEVETYEARVKKLMDSPGRPWPQDMHYPKMPEPLFDSRDPGLTPKNSSFFGVTPALSGGSGADLRNVGTNDWDGNSQGEVEGYESKASFDAGNKVPFKGLHKR